MLQMKKTTPKIKEIMTPTDAVFSKMNYDFEFIEKSSDDNSVDIFFEHTVNGQKYKLNIIQESNGTQKLFNVLPLVG